MRDSFGGEVRTEGGRLGSDTLEQKSTCNTSVFAYCEEFESIEVTGHLERTCRGQNGNFIIRFSMKPSIMD